MKRIKRKTLLEEKIGCHEWMMYDESQKMVYLLNDNAFFIYILQEPLSDIMNGEKLSQFIDLVHSRRDRIDTCKTCAFKGVCAGGCPAQAYIENGTINSVTARCKSRKQHFGKAFSAILDEMKRKSPIVEISVNEDI